MYYHQAQGKNPFESNAFRVPRPVNEGYREVPGTKILAPGTGNLASAVSGVPRQTVAQAQSAAVQHMHAVAQMEHQGIVPSVQQLIGSASSAAAAAAAPPATASLPPVTAHRRERPGTSSSHPKDTTVINMPDDEEEEEGDDDEALDGEAEDIALADMLDKLGGFCAQRFVEVGRAIQDSHSLLLKEMQGMRAEVMRSMEKIHYCVSRDALVSIFQQATAAAMAAACNKCNTIEEFGSPRTGPSPRCSTTRAPSVHADRSSNSALVQEVVATESAVVVDQPVVTTDG